MLIKICFVSNSISPMHLPHIPNMFGSVETFKQLLHALSPFCIELALFLNRVSRTEIVFDCANSRYIFTVLIISAN